MKLFCSILFTCYMVFRPLIPIVEYAVNYDYIVNTLCINKSKPEIHCNGKCFLNKELAKANDSETSPFSKAKNSGQKILDIYILPGITEISVTGKIPFSNGQFIYEAAYSFLFLNPIFKPPVF